MLHGFHVRSHAARRPLSVACRVAWRTLPSDAPHAVPPCAICCKVQEDLVLVWFGASSVVIGALALAYVCINRAFLDAHTAVDWMTTKCFCLCG